ncbi:MAG TPA: MBL fold metallo-hydrolase [Chthoniobacteraceae bacterium]|nr:MBL fold metallo-hydrolase [Chthoniobacteraceae bacterium]
MSIRLTFLGAAGCVTGSAYLVETSKARLLVDFGVFQGFSGADGQNIIPPQLRPEALNAVVLTHAHNDHTGRLPMLIRAGYAGPIHCTGATIEMSELILRDSAKVQAQDIMRVNRRRERAGQPPADPLFNVQDVDETMTRFHALPYDEPVPVAPGIRACFAEAGHILGSASIKLFIEDGPQRKTIAFSGDLGGRGMPILKDPEGFSAADVVVLESTYGDRDHKPLAQTVAEFEEIVKSVAKRGGKMLVPTFAVGRAQLLIYLLAQMFREESVPKFPIYLDSPMAVAATLIVEKHRELYDDDFNKLNRHHPIREDLDSLKATQTADESRALNLVRGPCIILAGSGMCNAGRILHHLRQNLWKPDTAVVIVGFQSEGSLGRLLVDGRPMVRIFGEEIAVKASVHTLNGFSAHAGQTDLLHWLAPLAQHKPRVFLTHGEVRGREPLAQKIRERFGIESVLPQFGDHVTL